MIYNILSFLLNCKKSMIIEKPIICETPYWIKHWKEWIIPTINGKEYFEKYWQAKREEEIENEVNSIIEEKI